MCTTLKKKREGHEKREEKVNFGPLYPYIFPLFFYFLNALLIFYKDYSTAIHLTQSIIIDFGQTYAKIYNHDRNLPVNTI